MIEWRATADRAGKKLKPSAARTRNPWAPTDCRSVGLNQNFEADLRAIFLQLRNFPLFIFFSSNK
jgi:hypothetical protein